MSSAELIEIADRLYAESAAEFTAARDAAAKACPDRSLAKQVKGLKKPSVAAWAVNLLVRHEAEQIDQVLALGESLRAAAESLDGDELRALTRQRRQLTTALASTARSLARERDVRLTTPVVDQVEGMINAAMLDPVAADVVRSGMVLTAFTSTGVSDLEVGTLVAVPGAIGHRAAAAVFEPPTLSVVPDDHLKVEAAQDRVAEAAQRVEEATGDLGEIAGSIEDLRAKRLQLREEIDELQRKQAALEDDVDGVDDDLEEAEGARDEAVGVLDDARAEQAEAEAALKRLTGEG